MVKQTTDYSTARGKYHEIVFLIPMEHLHSVTYIKLALSPPPEICLYIHHLFMEQQHRIYTTSLWHFHHQTSKHRTMLFRLLLFILIVDCYCANRAAPLSPLPYQQAEVALKRYTLNPAYNPIIHSLFNVYVHDKRGRAFISDDAIELALIQIKELDQISKSNVEKTLREFIHAVNCRRLGKNCQSSSHRQKINRLTPDVKQKIVVALDDFFQNGNFDDELSAISEGGSKTSV